MIFKRFTGAFPARFFLVAMAVLGACAILFTAYISFVKKQDNIPAVGGGRIYGQVIYDQHVALPPQAMLGIQLTAREHVNNSRKIIADIRQNISEQVPVDFILPVTTAQLDKNYSYTLQARISVGDTLWFVNESPMPVEPERTGYLIRLTMVERNDSETTDKNRIKGREWIAEDILNNGITENSRIILHIDNAAKTGTSDDAENHYSVSGSGGCNRYFTTATLNENEKTLKFDLLGMTFMACAAEAVSMQEAQFSDMMSKVRAYRIDQTRLLYLLDENHNALARFAAAN